MSKKKKKGKTSPAVKAANRLNAQKSTGPKTPEGKAISAKNSYKHGLSSQTFRILEWEDPEAFAQLQAEAIAQYNPQTLDEDILVSQIIRLTWEVNRVSDLITQVISTLWQDSISMVRAIERLRRYRLSTQKQLDEVRIDLHALQTATHERRLKQEVVDLFQQADAEGWTAQELHQQMTPAQQEVLGQMQEALLQKELARAQQRPPAMPMTLYDPKPEKKSTVNTTSQ